MDVFSLHLHELTDKFVTWLGSSGIKILFIIIGTFIVRRLLTALIASVLRRWLHFEQAIVSDLDREKRVETFISLINAILSIVIWIAAGLLILQAFGLDTAPFLAGAGVLGVALAFGTQSLVKDFVSGLFIAMENQYRVGDQVELDSTKGTVERLGIRTTILRDDKGNIHFVPNGAIGRTMNKSMGFTFLRLGVAVDQKITGSQIKKIINQTGEKLQNEKKWRPQFAGPLSFHKLAEEDGQKIFIVAGSVKNAYHTEIYKEFRKRLRAALAQKDIKLKKCVEMPDKEADSEKDDPK